MAEVQLKVDRLKKEQKKREALAAKIRVSLHSDCCRRLILSPGDGEQTPGGWAEHR